MDRHEGPRIVKVGGRLLGDREGIRRLARRIVALADPPILVHGGGPAVARLQERLGRVPRYVEGLRVTEDEDLELVTMVLAGWANKALVAALVAEGVDALGLSGVDLGLIRVQRRTDPPGLGWVGQVDRVRSEFLWEILSDGIVPVIAPICLGLDGGLYNVNADQVAQALARVLRVRELVFVTDVPGLLLEGRPLRQVTAEEARHLLENGQVSGGMRPKLQAALDALASGVPRVRICDLEGLEAGGTHLGEGEMEALSDGALV